MYNIVNKWVIVANTPADGDCFRVNEIMGDLYVPILKWKKGERLALENLIASHKSRIIPLLELIDDDDVNEIIGSITPHLEYYC